MIVLLTDGANNRGIEPLDAVPYAVARKVRVYTIGFGTTQLAAAVVHRGPAGRGRRRWGRGSSGASEVAGSAASAPTSVAHPWSPISPPCSRSPGAQEAPPTPPQDASQLHKVFATLPKDVSVSRERHEISSTFVALGALLALHRHRGVDPVEPVPLSGSSGRSVFQVASAGIRADFVAKNMAFGGHPRTWQ